MSGTASATRTSDGLVSTSPIAPSSSWWVTRMTVRRKFGSTSAGEEISSFPCNDIARDGTSARAERDDACESDPDAADLHARQPFFPQHVGEKDRGDRVERAEHRDECEQPAATREREEGVGRDVAEPDREHRDAPAPPDP